MINLLIILEYLTQNKKFSLKIIINFPESYSIRHYWVREHNQNRVYILYKTNKNFYRITQLME